MTTWAVGEYEANGISNQFDLLKTDAASNNNITTRLAYGGVKAKDIGTVTFGRQKGAVSTGCMDWRCIEHGCGNDGLGIKTDMVHIVLVICWNMLVILVVSKLIPIINSAQTQVIHQHFLQQKVNQNDAAYGAALSYSLMDKISLGAGQRWQTWCCWFQAILNYGLLALNTTTKHLYRVKLWQRHWLYCHWYWCDRYGEAALGYNFANGFGLMSAS